MQVGEESVVVAEVMSARTGGSAGAEPSSSSRSNDDTGALRVVFFNQGWRAKQLPAGTNALFFGKLDTYRGQRPVHQPGRRPRRQPNRADRADLPDHRGLGHRRLGVRGVGGRGSLAGRGRFTTRSRRGS